MGAMGIGTELDVTIESGPLFMVVISRVNIESYGALGSFAERIGSYWELGNCWNLGFYPLEDNG